MALRKREVTVGTAGIIAGALVGAGVALLFAPKSGDETRADIARFGRKARRRVEELTDDFSDKVDGVIRSMEGTAKEILDKGRDVTSDTARTVRGVIEGGRGVLGKRFAA